MKSKKMLSMLLPLAAMASMGETMYGGGYGGVVRKIGMGIVKKWQPSHTSSSTRTPKQKKLRLKSKVQRKSRKINRR